MSLLSVNCFVCISLGVFVEQIDGKNSRRYIYASDASDASDAIGTILHKGSVGQIFSVGSADVVANICLCHKLLKMFGIPASDVAEHQGSPLHDLRYAADDSRLRDLGWRQKVQFNEVLERTVQ